MRDEVILTYCGIKKCYDMNAEIEEVFGKYLTLCQTHSKEFKDVIGDIILLEDYEWMKEWAHENLKDEIADKWDNIDEHWDEVDEEDED